MHDLKTRAAIAAYATFQGLPLAMAEQQITEAPDTDRQKQRWMAVGEALAAIAQAEADAERNRCRYPACTENDDERCPRWLTGECPGPKAGAAA